MVIVCHSMHNVNSTTKAPLMSHSVSHILTMVINPENGKITQQSLDVVYKTMADKGMSVGDTKTLCDGIAYDIATGDINADTITTDMDYIRQIANQHHVDVAIFPVGNRRKKILVSDMDSTVLQMETLDYMCGLLGIGDAVEAITERSMRGEIDFAESLTERVGLITGMSTHVMDELLDNLDYTAGAKTTIATLVRDGVQCALVSGGFTFTTAVVAEQTGFQHHYANTLGIDGDTFTGKLVGELSGPATKGEVLQSLMDTYQVDISDTCAIGDGANDIPMLKMANMGVAFYGKPVVRQATDIQINVTDYSTLLYYMGYHRDEFVS